MERDGLKGLKCKKELERPVESLLCGKAADVGALLPPGVEREERNWWVVDRKRRKFVPSNSDKRDRKIEMTTCTYYISAVRA